MSGSTIKNLFKALDEATTSVDSRVFVFMKETWKSIPKYEGYYEISTKGRIKSFWNNGGKREAILSPHFMGVARRNYYQISLYKNGVKETKRIHALMAITFLGHVYDGNRKIVVDHIDNDPLNNNLSNLQIISMRENNMKENRNKGQMVFDF